VVGKGGDKNYNRGVVILVVGVLDYTTGKVL